MGRSKTPTTTTSASESAASSSTYSSPNSSFSSRSQYTQPALPQKSNARSPSIASVHALGGGQGYDYSGRSKSSLGSHSNHSGGQQQQSTSFTTSETANRDWERERMRANRSAPIPDFESQYNISTPAPVPARSGSNVSSVSAAAERRANRNRSNTMQSDRSELTLRSEPIRSRQMESISSTTSSSDRYRRPEREREREKELPLTPSSSRSGTSGRRLQDAASAYKTPSPPVSSREDDGDIKSTMGSTPGSSYRPLTPPEIASPIPTRGRRPSIAQPTSRRTTAGGNADQFDALMEDLLQQIDILPTTSSSPASRNSTRNSTRDSTRHSTRSRSRSLVAEAGSRIPMDNDNAAAPPTPRLPFSTTGDGNNSRSDSPSNMSASARSQQRRLERERERNEYRSERSDREHASSSPRPQQERSDSGREPELENDRVRDRERTRDRDRTRSTSSSALSSRSRSAHPTATNAIASSTTSSSSSLRSDPRATTNATPTVCQGCQYDIRPSEVSRSIKMGRTGDFHPECFKCTRCRKLLESSRDAHEFEGHLYCDKDYSRMVEKGREKEKLRIQRRRLPTCAGCDGAIHADEATVYALGQTWHDRHLQCYHCRKPIPQPTHTSSSTQQQQQGHVEKNGRIYCPQDFASLFLPKCRGCNKPVEREAVSAQDGKLKGKWHTACFGCHTCHRPFPDKSFYVFGDAPYCRRHYHKMNNSLCKTCDEPIEGPCAQAVEGWRFHPHCFSCAECKTPLTDIYYNFENKAYCERDILIIQRSRGNVRAERRRTFFGKI
ncbi:hypothetical protein EC991_009416 [Linnemannia zychae]|nr:hypothetical protein EC991_009416 [Linnemannia zychae]